MNDYYVIENNTIIGLKDKFKSFLLENNNIAPPIEENINNIKSDVFNTIDEINEIYLSSSIKDLNIKVFERFENIKINYSNLFYITIRKKDLYGNYNKIYKLSGYHEDLNKYLDKSNGTLDNIPKWVSCIGEFTFKDNKHIKRVYLDHEISIFKETFKNCTNLKTIENSFFIRDYGDDAFNNCINLEKVEIKTNIVNIRSNVFKNCNRIKICLFDKDELNNNEFTIPGRNLYMKDRNYYFKVLKTKNDYYFINNDSVDIIKKNKFTYPNTINKYLGYKYNRKKYLEDYLETAYFMYKKLSYIPYDFILKNINASYVDNYITFMKDFEKNILKKSCLISNKEDIYKDSTVKRINTTNYETLLKISIISGFFEKEEAKRKKSINLINNYLLPIDGNKGLNLSLDKFTKLFKNIDSRYVRYNEEFSEYFLYKKDNLKKLINKMSNNNDFINIILSKCGDSTIEYKHDDVYEKSHGLLHDEWIIYRNNNNDKHINTINTNKSTVLGFVDWALTLDEHNNFSSLNVDKKTIELFSPFYESEKAIIKIQDIITNSKGVIPYIFIPDNLCKTKNEEYVISHIYREPVKRAIEVSRINNEDKISNIINKEKDLITINEENYKAEILDKSSYLISYVSCMMGTCSVVTSNGCEYLYEAYYDNSCQPFIIYKNNKPIANFRIDLDKKTGNASINSLEVLSDVKFNYSLKEKKLIIKIFKEMIKNFISIYNKYNDIPINKISMGKLSNYDINDVLSLFFKTTDNSFYIKKRTICTPSTNNHFIIYERK